MGGPAPSGLPNNATKVSIAGQHDPFGITSVPTVVHAQTRSPSRRTLRCAATGAGWLIAAVLTPRSAWALPGPEVVLPLAAGVVQAVLGLLWIARRLQHQTRRLLWRAAVLTGAGTACWLLLGWQLGLLGAAAAGLLGARRWLERGAWVLVGAVAIHLAIPTLDRPDMGQTPPVPVPFDSPLPLAGPFARASLEPLQHGPAHVIELGEREDFINCAVAGATLIRPADLPARTPELQALSAPVVLLVGPSTPRTDAIESARALGFAHVAEFRDVFHAQRAGAVCYAPPHAAFFKRFVPKTLVAQVTMTPGAPLELDWVPWLRPTDLAHLAATRSDLSVSSAFDVLQLPTADLSAAAGSQVALHANDLHRLAAAARLLRSAGAEVVSITLGKSLEPIANRSLTPAILAAAAIAAALLAMLLGLLGQLGALRAEAAHARGRGPPSGPSAWRAAAELGSWLAVGGVAWWVGGWAVPPSLASWVTPTMLSSEALSFGAAWFIVPPGVLWLRVTRLAGWWRLGGAVLAVLICVGVVPGLLLGFGVLPVHVAIAGSALLGGPVAERALVVLWRRHCRDNAGHEPGWALLDHVAALPAAGGKAARLAARRSAGAPVPPGLVVWPLRDGSTRRMTLTATGVALGSGPLLVRSTARSEDLETATAAGRWPSRVANGLDQLPGAIRQVVTSYANEDGLLPAVLIMPLVECTRGGVAQVPLAGTSVALVEHGRGRDAVTSGGETQRSYWGRLSGSWLGDERVGPELIALGKLLGGEASGPPRYLEWLARGSVLWLVQDRPAPAGAALEGSGAIDALCHLVSPPREATAPWLHRASVEGLPIPAPRQSLELWAQCWSRSGAIGDASGSLGIPRWLLAPRTVVAAWGSLWAFDSEVGGIARLVQLRLTLSAAVTRRGHGTVAGQLAHRLALAPHSLDEAQARSIGLRLLQPYLEPELGEPPPTSPSIRLAAALREAGGPDRLPPAFGHRARWDLDLATPRYGETAESSWRPPDEPPPWPDEPPPAVLDRRWCGYYRDLLHDRLAWEIARLRASAGELPERPASGALPEANTLSLRDAEAIGLPITTNVASGTGTWVSGSGPIEGVATRDLQRHADRRILVVDAPTPEHAARFADFAAVVAATGGSLSHAALVARELGIPALFGVGAQALRGRGHLVLTSEGCVEWLRSDAN